jgi:hypothetical protein
MTSTFTWLAHDEAERRRMQEAVELFREQGTLDDLGIGSVRDAFSNLLFPGTSVLHTRARYFLFIPWIYRRLEQEGVRSREVAARARRYEIRLIEALRAGGETRGVIGERARLELKQLPSEAYWSGLGAFGFRLFHGTQDQYHRSFDGYRQLVRSAPRVSDDEDPVASIYRNWHPTLDDLAAECPGFLERAEFALSLDEGAFVRELILRHASKSFMALVTASGAPSSVAYAWLHPRVAAAPRVLQRQLELAATFSGVMHGAALLYNLMLAQRRQFDPLVDELTTRLEQWDDSLDAGAAEMDWIEFWEIASDGNPRISSGTRLFVEGWFGRALALGAGVADDARTRVMIERRERQTKHAQARLSNPRRLETWTAPVGMGRLDYRWSVVQVEVNDVLAATRKRSRARG